MNRHHSARLSIALLLLAVLSLGACNVTSLSGTPSPTPNPSILTDSVSGCDKNGVGISFSAVRSDDGNTFMLNTVTVRGIASACVGKNFAVTVYTRNDGLVYTVLLPKASLDGTGEALSKVFDFSAQRLQASNVDRIAVAIK
jgi:hypothetical protein